MMGTLAAKRLNNFYKLTTQSPTLKEENFVGRKCRKSREIFFESVKLKVTGIKCFENSKINISWGFKVAKCLKGKKPV